MSTLQRDPGERVEILDEDGQVRDGATVPDLGDEALVEMYRQITLARHFDQRAVSLQRQGRMGTYPPLSGQEASQIGSAHALDEDDWLFPSYREAGAAVVRGVPLEKILLFWMGHEDGNAVPEDVNMFTMAVPIATQVPHATGAAWASKLEGERKAFLCYFGDGATSEGDFHEGMNFAGVFDTPTVFFCNNNQWAISVPRERQTASATLAQKAHAYGFEGVQVDGMDPLAVYQVTRDAVEKAKDPDDDDRGRPVPLRGPHHRRRPLGLPGRRRGRGVEAQRPHPTAGDVPARAWPAGRRDRRRHRAGEFGSSGRGDRRGGVGRAPRTRRNVRSRLRGDAPTLTATA
jgi:pyruvate dehydrogenase E1 component alpha subunit